MKKCKLLFSLDQLILNVIAPVMIIAELRLEEVGKEK